MIFADLSQVRNAGEMVEGKRDVSRCELATVDAEVRQARSLEHQSSQQHESWHNTVQQTLNDLHLQNAEAQTRLREELHQESRRLQLERVRAPVVTTVVDNSLLLGELVQLRAELSATQDEVMVYGQEAINWEYEAETCQQVAEERERLRWLSDFC